MDILNLHNVSSDVISKAADESLGVVRKNSGFDEVFKSALGMINETNQLQMDAETTELEFAMGESENTHDLVIAQQKASIALQYTVAVRDKIIEAYNSIMQMQI